jgi:integrase
MKARRGNGESSIYQRKSDGRWCGAITIGVTSKGTPARKVVYGKTRKEVAAKLAELERLRDTGQTLDGLRVTVGAWLARWIAETATPRVRPATRISYQRYCGWYIVPHLGRITLAKLKIEDVQRMQATLLASGLAPRTVTRARTILNMALKEAVRRGLVARNVAGLTDGPHLEAFEHVVMLPDQARALLRAAQGTPLAALLHLALLLGLRKGELTALRWQDVDFIRDELRVARTMTYADQGGQFGEPKTKAGRRVLPLSEGLIRLLEDQWKADRARQVAAGPAWQDLDLVFPHTDGRPWPRSSLDAAFKRLLRDAGLPAMRFHDLRHACATLLADEGVPPRTAMEILGHSSVAVTLGIYTRALQGAKRDAIGALDRLLLDVPEEP